MQTIDKNLEKGLQDATEWFMVAFFQDISLHEIVTVNISRYREQTADQPICILHTQNQHNSDD